MTSTIGGPLERVHALVAVADRLASHGVCLQSIDYGHFPGFGSWGFEFARAADVERDSAAIQAWLDKRRAQPPPADAPAVPSPELWVDGAEIVAATWDGHDEFLSIRSTGTKLIARENKWEVELERYPVPAEEALRVVEEFMIQRLGAPGGPSSQG